MRGILLIVYFINSFYIFTYFINNRVHTSAMFVKALCKHLFFKGAVLVKLL